VDSQTDRDIVSPITRQPVDLMDDDVVDIPLIQQTIEQLLQSWPIGRASRGAGIDVLLNDAGAKGFGSLPASTALGGDGIALDLSTTGCLTSS
jgi:hypothetical protein